ncbi:hypothetical protein [Streptomyces sp. EWL5.16]
MRTPQSYPAPDDWSFLSKHAVLPAAVAVAPMFVSRRSWRSRLSGR